MRVHYILALAAALIGAAPAAAQEHHDSTAAAAHAKPAAHPAAEHAPAHDKTPAAKPNADTAHPAEGAAEPHHAPAIVTSRPGLAEYTGVVPRGTMQFEGGYSLARLQGENHHSIGEARFRYGVGDGTEIRIDLNSFGLAVHHGHQMRGYEDAEIGVKRELTHSDSPWIPSSAVVLSTTMPTGSGDFASGHWQPAGALSLGWALPEHLSVTSSVRYTEVDDHGHKVGHVTGATSVGLPSWGNLHSHVEYALILPTADLHERIHHFSGGYGYHVGHNAQIDIWGGAALIQGESELLFGVGLSRRW